MQQHLALIVEDDAGIADIYREALQSTGYTVELCRNGSAGLAWLAQAAPNLVILDLGLPDISGEKLLRHIRSDPRLAGTHVIITTGDARRAEALTTQADLVLVKPVSFNQLSDLASRLWSSGAAVSGDAT